MGYKLCLKTAITKKKEKKPESGSASLYNSCRRANRKGSLGVPCHHKGPERPEEQELVAILVSLRRSFL